MMGHHFVLILCILISLFATSGGAEIEGLDCAMRNFALQMAEKALPWLQSSKDIYDALELSKCPGTKGYSFQGKVKQRILNLDEDASNAPTFHVCPRRGKDSFEGNETHPFATLQRALEATRRLVKRKVIVLHQGIHYLNETIEIDQRDSFLTIRRAAGEERPWLSGGVLLESETIGWKYLSKNIWVVDLSKTLPPTMESITGLFTVSPHERMTLARYPNANVEDWNAHDRYIPSKEVQEWFFPPFGKVPEMYTIELRDPDNPTGYSKDDSAMTDYNRFGTGKGGVCSTVWGDKPSYWCGNVSAGGWAEVDQKAALAGRLNLPRGMAVAGSLAGRMKNWTHAHGAIVHVSHTQGWAWHMFNISTISASQQDNTTVRFDTGGWQGGRNWQCTNADGHLSHCHGEEKKLKGGDWYVEGVLEELDAPGEFYFEPETKLLYFFPNHTETLLVDGASEMVQRRTRAKLPPPNVIATNLQTLIRIKGTMDEPVKGIRLLGLGFRDAAKTYMEQWSAPSGGDWALHRGGAVHLEAVEHVSIIACNFTRLDGNAVMLGGYSRHVRIAESEFAWIGNGAVATWGDTVDDGYDATRGDQPRFSIMEHNLVHDIGLYQKQSSAWGQNKACQSTIRRNVVFNIPRAAINFNDGLGGGNLVERNIIFNTCRESGDHGAINSWDRMPFLTDVPSSGPSFTPLPTRTRKNLIFANYGASRKFTFPLSVVL
jgi:hypothetical protein